MLVPAQDIAFSHDVLGFIASHHSSFLQHFNRVETLICITASQENLAETSAAQHPQELKVVGLQPETGRECELNDCVMM